MSGELPTDELARIEPILRRIGLQVVIHGNREAAHALVDQIFAPPEPEYDERDPASAPLSVVIAEERLFNMIFEHLRKPAERGREDGRQVHPLTDDLAAKDRRG